MDATMAVPPGIFNQSLGYFKNGLHSVDKVSPVNIRQESRILGNNVDHLRLDDTFLTKSSNWSQRFPQRQLATERSGVVSTADKGSNFLRNYSTAMSPSHVSTLEANQLRSQDAWAMQNMQQIRSEIQPLANAAHKRIGQFSDWIGVTDRYTGYRNNLSRSDKPMEYAPAWRQGSNMAGQQMQWHPEAISKRHVTRFNVRTTSAPVMSEKGYSSSRVDHATHRAMKSAAPFRTPQEAAGIIVKYPGITEYKDRYKRTNKTGTEFDYTINPTPNFAVIGRPLLPMPKDDKRTEYIYSYEWPSPDKVPTLPWRR